MTQLTCLLIIKVLAFVLQIDYSQDCIYSIDLTVDTLYNMFNAVDTIQGSPLGRHGLEPRKP